MCRVVRAAAVQHYKVKVAELELEVVHTVQAKSRLIHKLRSKKAQHKEAMSELALARSIAAQRYALVQSSTKCVNALSSNVSRLIGFPCAHAALLVSALLTSVISMVGLGVLESILGPTFPSDAQAG